MYFSPIPHTKRYPSTDELNRYLPQIQQSQSTKQEALYTRFSTVDQIAKSIHVEKQMFDEQQIIFNSRLTHSTHLITKAKKDISNLRRHIDNINLANLFQQTNLSTFQSLPPIPLETISYTLKEKPKCSSLTKKDQIQIFLSEIQKLQKESAQFYLTQTKKFQSFQKELSIELAKFNDKLVTENHSKSYYTLMQLRIAQNQQKIQKKIKEQESKLNQQLDDKILKIIQQVENTR